MIEKLNFSKQIQIQMLLKGHIQYNSETQLEKTTTTKNPQTCV